MDPITLFPDPDKVCQSEYRAIYDCIKDAIEDAPEDERMEIALSMLQEFKVWSKGLKEVIKSYSKKSKRRRK